MQQHPLPQMPSSMQHRHHQHHHHHSTSSIGQQSIQQQQQQQQQSQQAQQPQQQTGTSAPQSQQQQQTNTTRVLLLSGFSPSLKTRDIQQAFSEWENDRGGLKIKWKDDTSCLVVFNDPITAKHAYLSVLNNPPISLNNPDDPTLTKPATLRPYTAPDVAQILQTVQNRPRSRSNAGSTSMRHHRKGSSQQTAVPALPTTPQRNSNGVSAHNTPLRHVDTSVASAHNSNSAGLSTGSPTSGSTNNNHNLKSLGSKSSSSLTSPQDERVQTPSSATSAENNTNGPPSASSQLSSPTNSIPNSATSNIPPSSANAVLSPKSANNSNNISPTSSTSSSGEIHQQRSRLDTAASQRMVTGALGLTTNNKTNDGVSIPSA